MTVLAVLTVVRVQSVGSTAASFALSGCTSDGVFNFRDDSSDGILNVSGINIESHRLQQDIEDAAKSKLQSAPYNMSFGSADVVRLV